ncbi:MAG: RNA-binding S4 domain-containing protein [Bacteroidales bacterium]|jgi:ribosome-associated heat shock protein Hsp15|nr:RNA-binding S4 domain-containing protein [Bacteroidales bacterium]
MEDRIRIDKFLWTVRLFKTRSVASEACNAGKIKIRDVNVKPSREVVVGDEIHALLEGGLHKTIRVKALLKNRIGAKLVSEYIEDLTPPEEYERVFLLQKMMSEKRERGSGRPTKKDRRELDWLKGDC